MQSAKHFLSVLAVAGLLVHANDAGAYSNKATFAAEVFFEQGDDTLATAQQEKLRAFADRIDKHQLEVIIAVGHAAPGETDTKALSERRAASTRFTLIQLGIPPYRIYTEGKADTQAAYAQDATQMPRAEIEYVGTYGAAPYTHGFNSMWTWHRDFLPGQERPQLNKPPATWDTSRPEQFFPAITNPAWRLRFLDKYRLVAILRNDDSLLREIENLRPPAASAQTALMAIAFGTPFAQSVFASAIDRLDVTEPGGHELAEQLWCDNSWRTSARRLSFQRMKIPQMLRTLSAAEQKRWTECAARRTDVEALGFLKSNGVNLSARNEQGETALHAVVSRFDPGGIRVLVAAGADPNAQDASGRTPLHGLASANYGPMTGRPQADQLRQAWATLTAAGANPSIQDYRGSIPAPVKP